MWNRSAWIYRIWSGSWAMRLNGQKGVEAVPSLKYDKRVYLGSLLISPMQFLSLLGKAREGMVREKSNLGNIWMRQAIPEVCT